jgi:hypothetical protein
MNNFKTNILHDTAFLLLKYIIGCSLSMILENISREKKESLQFFPIRPYVDNIYEDLEIKVELGMEWNLP